MNVTWISLAVVFALLSPSTLYSEDQLLLTPANAQDHGYWVRCIVKDRKANRRDDLLQAPPASDPALVILRIGLVHDGRLHNGPFAVDPDDLQVIRSVSLVVRESDAVLLSVPLRTHVDPGNQIHLLAEFSAQRETVQKMQVVFHEHGEAGGQKVAINLSAFLPET